MPHRAKAGPSPPPSPVALIGFGAVVALASAVFPWYLLGQPTSPEAAVATISGLLHRGWQWFPGVPLAIITTGAVVSTLLAILAGRGRAHPLAAIVVGIIILFSAGWLGLGLRTPTPATEVSSLLTGPALAIIGAFVIVASGLWLIRQASNPSQRQKLP